MSIIYTARQTLRSLCDSGRMKLKYRSRRFGRSRNESSSHMGSGESGVTSGEEDAMDLKDIVMYRDLSHASWEDYQAPPQKKQKEHKDQEEPKVGRSELVSDDVIEGEWEEWEDKMGR
jgi:hypothetical protein